MTTEFKHLKCVGENFWNLRSSLVMFRFVDIGTHMSFIRLSTGKFLVIDCIDLSNKAVKREVDTLTENGSLIEAVLGVHPFHTLFFPAFQQLYPNAGYYGTPRHLRNFVDMKWSGSLGDEATRCLWEAEEVFLRIPDGAEFEFPPAEDVHFSSVVVFHAHSKTLHVDDTINYFHGAGWVLRLLGKKDNLMEFWSLEKGLDHTPESPRMFKAWVEHIIHDWDFDNICAAHNNNKIGDAKRLLEEALHTAQPEFDRLALKWKSVVSKKCTKQCNKK
jgi:hypothetical protein